MGDRGEQHNSINSIAPHTYLGICSIVLLPPFVFEFLSYCNYWLIFSKKPDFWVKKSLADEDKHYQAVLTITGYVLITILSFDLLRYE